jgi:hypothetical protein
VEWREIVCNWEFERLSTIEEFVAIKEEWTSILSASKQDNIFLTHSWLSSWWRVYGCDVSMWLLVARIDDHIIGFAPFMIVRSSIGLKTLTFMGVSDLKPVHLDFVILPEFHNEFLMNILCYLDNHKEKWDLLDLQGLSEDSPSLRYLKNWFLTSNQSQYRIGNCEACPCITLPQSFTEYIQSRSKNTRKNFHKRRAKLIQNFPDMELGYIDTLDGWEMAYHELVRLHQARWENRGYAGSFAGDKFAKFMTVYLPRGLVDGTVRIYYMKVGSEYIAIEVCFCNGKKAFDYISGFDEAYSQFSIGTQILVYAIEQSILDGYCEFDLLLGETKYKYDWATDTCDDFRVSFPSGTLLGWLSWILWLLTEQVRTYLYSVIYRKSLRTLRKRVSTFLPNLLSFGYFK